MALNVAAHDIAANALRGQLLYLSLHTATPDAAGSNQSTAARVAASWPASASGVLTVTNKAFTGGTASGACTHVGFWSLASGGVFYGYQTLGGTTTFDATGAYTITSLTVTLSST